MRGREDSSNKASYGSYGNTTSTNSYGRERTGGSAGNGYASYGGGSSANGSLSTKGYANYRSNSAGIRAHASSSRDTRQNPSSQYQQQDTGNDSEEEIGQIKGQIRQAKVETFDSTERSLRMLDEAHNTGKSTLEKLNQQTEQILNMDRKVEQTSITAEDSVGETSRLRTLNKSILHFHVGNPFTKKKRREAELLKNEEKRMFERQANERKVRDVQDSRRRVAQASGSDVRMIDRPVGRMDASGRIVSTTSASKSDRSRYMVEGEDPELENDINSNLDKIGHAVGQLTEMAHATNRELKAQEDPLRRIRDNTDKTSGHIGIANYHLNRIK
ncbi:Protein transport protein S9 plasma membrane t-SNARE [Coemansia sp. RSA 988]|nr:Protein transport protein S9 plasma membrane t-SNARE [Coemansia sp. RSA 988]